MMNSDKLTPIFETFEPLDAAYLDRLESTLGKILPVDYKTFLEAIGACGFAGDACVKSTKGDFPIFSLFGKTGERDLMKTLLQHPDFLEDRKLPVGDDMFSNLYVLDPENGVVFFVDYTGEEVSAHRVAASFSEFFNAIEVRPFAE